MGNPAITFVPTNDKLGLLGPRGKTVLKNDSPYLTGKTVLKSAWSIMTAFTYPFVSHVI